MSKKKNTTVIFGTEVPKSCTVIPKYRRDEQDKKAQKTWGENASKVSRMSRTRKGGRAERMKQDALHGKNADTTHHAHVRHLEKMTEGHGNWWNLITEDLRNKKAEEVRQRQMAKPDRKIICHFYADETDEKHLWELSDLVHEKISVVCTLSEAYKMADERFEETGKVFVILNEDEYHYTLVEENGVLYREYDDGYRCHARLKDQYFVYTTGYKDTGCTNITTSVKEVVRKAVTEYLGFSL